MTLAGLLQAAAQDEPIRDAVRRAARTGTPDATMALEIGAPDELQPVLLAALARRVGAPNPALLAVGGALLALAPGGPRLALDPDLALALFVAPVLLDAAYDTSLTDLRANWRPVLGFVLGAVLATTAAVAWVAHALLPGLPWAATVALGTVDVPCVAPEP